jgi:hypothetical protein
MRTASRLPAAARGVNDLARGSRPPVLRWRDSMKALRVLLIAVAVAVAAFLAFRGVAGRVRDAQPDPEPPPADPKDPSQFPTLVAPPAPATAAVAKKDPEPLAAETDPAPGTPVKDGAEVSVVVPYRAGTKSRYRVNDSYLQKDRQENAVQSWRYVWDVSTEVVSGDGTGPARVRFKIDSFEFDTTDSIGRPVKMRSKEPDKKLLADIQYARSMKPRFAILGMPAEFVIGAGDDVTAVEGVGPMNRAFLDAVDALGAQYTRDVADAPTVELLTQKWSEILFPPLGGGTLKAGATRDASFRTTYYDRWCAVTSGKLRVTHDDPGSFRVEFRGKPVVEELNRPATNASALAVAKVQAVASDDCVVATWRFDRSSGRLVRGDLSAKFRMDVSIATPGQGNGFAASFTDVERQIVTELLDK